MLLLPLTVPVQPLKALHLMEHICGMLIAGVSKISKLAFRSVIRTTFTVKNKGNKDLEIDTISLIGTDVSEFSIQNDNCSGQTVAPAGTRNAALPALFRVARSPRLATKP